MTCDVDYGSRLKLLSELMETDPDKPVKKLQREALKYYPLFNPHAIKHWLSYKVAFEAAEILNKNLLERLKNDT